MLFNITERFHPLICMSSSRVKYSRITLAVLILTPGHPKEPKKVDSFMGVALSLFNSSIIFVAEYSVYPSKEDIFSILNLNRSGIFRINPALKRSSMVFSEISFVTLVFSMKFKILPDCFTGQSTLVHRSLYRGFPQ